LFFLYLPFLFTPLPHFISVYHARRFACSLIKPDDGSGRDVFFSIRRGGFCTLPDRTRTAAACSCLLRRRHTRRAARFSVSAALFIFTHVLLLLCAGAPRVRFANATAPAVLRVAGA
jgi:hypothetical protein